jgi:hypothetical protein
MILTILKYLFKKESSDIVSNKKYNIKKPRRLKLVKIFKKECKQAEVNTVRLNKMALCLIRIRTYWTILFVKIN